MTKQSFLHRLLASSAGLATASTIAALLGVALNLVVPFVLPLGEYARYSLMLGISQLLASVLYEWARVNIIRFSNTSDLFDSSEHRSVLSFVYNIISTVLFVIAILGVALASVVPWLWYAGIVVGTAAMQGIFDGRQARSRAIFDNASVAVRTLLRIVLAFAGAVVGGVIFRTGEAALVGFALAYPLTILLRGRPTHDQSPAIFSPVVLWRMLKFGLPAAVGTNLSIGTPAVVRWVIVASAGLAEAGGALLAVDLVQRAFGTIGTSVNVAIVQNAIRAIELGDKDDVRERVREQLVLIICLIVPLVVIFAFAQWPIVAYLVPSPYRSGFEASGLAAAVAMGLMAVRQYSFDPMFIVLSRAGLAPVGAAVTLLFLISLGSFGVVGLHDVSADVIMNILVVAGFLGLVTTIATLVFTAYLPWPVSDMIWIGLSGLASVAVGLLLPPAEGILASAVVAALLLIVFLIGIVLGNVLGARSTMRLLFRSIRPH